MTTTATEVEFDPIDALTRGIAAMVARDDEIAQDRRYFEGDHPRLEWITKIRKVFGDQVADQVHQANYCEKAILAPLARMAVEGFSDITAEELFRKNGLMQAQEDLYSDAMIAAEGYVILAEAEPGSDVPYDIVVQRSENVYVEPGSLKPNDRLWAIKVEGDPYLGDEGGYRAWVWDGTDYYRFVAPVGNPDKTPRPKAGAFTPDPEDESGPHGFDRVPVIPFKRGRDPRSRLKSLRPVQDRIDMLEIEKVVAGLFGASKQRVFFTHQELNDGDTESSPDFAIVLDPGNKEDGQASVTEFTHTPLENFDKGIDAEIERFYELASLPKHGRVNPGAGASGEALKADEGDFVAMIRGYTGSWDAAWVEVFAMLGIETEVVWRDPETRNELTQMQVVKYAVDAGVPLETALVRWADFTADDLADLAKAKQTADAAAAAAREAAMQALDQGRSTSDVIDSNFGG